MLAKTANKLFTQKTDRNLITVNYFMEVWHCEEFIQEDYWDNNKEPLLYKDELAQEP